MGACAGKESEPSGGKHAKQKQSGGTSSAPPPPPPPPSAPKQTTNVLDFSHAQQHTQRTTTPRTGPASTTRSQAYVFSPVTPGDSEENGFANSARKETMWDRMHKGKPAGKTSADEGEGTTTPTSPQRRLNNTYPSKNSTNANTTATPLSSTRNGKPRTTSSSAGAASQKTSQTKPIQSKPMLKKGSGGGGAGGAKGKVVKKSKPEDPLAQFDLTPEERQMAGEMVDTSPGVAFDDISGLEGVKAILHEITVAPSLNPALFTGLRAPAKGVLFFGPPGNGKTLLAKAVATECKAHFISISASSITSKYVGESEKHIRSLFSLARKLQPCIIFIDEIDSMLTSRRANENDAARRLKTEFLVQMDGVGTGKEERLLILGATNRPQELDDAALRRLPKRVYIALPDKTTRHGLIAHKLKDENYKLDIAAVAQLTDGYSGSDLASLCSEAAMRPVREISNKHLATMTPDSVRPITLDDFKIACKAIRPSVDKSTLKQCLDWNAKFGSQ